MANEPVVIVLEGECPPSWNRFWAGTHWAVRRRQAQRIHALVRSAIDPECMMFTVPVVITVTAYFRGRRLDCSNICFKPYEDALVGWFIQDDSPEYVSEVRVRSCIDRARPRLEIRVEQNQ